MSLFKNLEKFLKHMKCCLMNRREINMIYTGLMELKFRLVQQDIIFRTQMISLEASSLQVDLIMLQIPHFSMHISRPIWEVWVEEQMEVHLTIPTQKHQIFHHTTPKLQEHQAHQHILHTFQNPAPIIIANIQLAEHHQETHIIPTLLNQAQRHRTNSFLHKVKQSRRFIMLPASLQMDHKKRSKEQLSSVVTVQNRLLNKI